MSVFKSIICSINLIEHSEDIVYYTRELAKQNDAKVYVVHSLPSMQHLRQFMSDSPQADDLINHTESKALEFTNEFIAKNFEGINCEPVVVQGDAANELLNLVDKFCADIVIMGSMSTKGFFSFFNSKAPQSIVGKTRVPVMIIPNDLDMDCLPEE